jgi:hypothetical protein
MILKKLQVQFENEKMSIDNFNLTVLILSWIVSEAKANITRLLAL